MNRLANVLLGRDESRTNDDLSALLSDNNFHIIPCHSGEGLINESRLGLPDIAILDVKSTGFDAFDLAVKLVSAVESTGMAVVLFNAGSSPETFEKAILSGIDDIFPGAITPDGIRSRLKPLLRLSTMRRETRQRRDLARSNGVHLDADISGYMDAGVYSLLHIGDNPGVFEAIKKSSSSGCQITSVPDAATADVTLGGDKFFDACFLILTDDASDPAEALEFCKRVRLNPRLFNLPVIVVKRPGQLLEADEAIAAGATQVIVFDGAPGELSASLILQARRQASRWRMSRALLETRAPETTDPRTGAYTFDFMKQGLSILLEAARIHEKHLTLVFFSFPDAHTVGEQFGEAASDHLLRQLATWIGAMVRTEDMVAHYTGHDFCIALPDTPPDEALYVMNRISGVLTYTDFALDEVYQPVSISVEFGLAGNQPGDTTETLINRARAHLD